MGNGLIVAGVIFGLAILVLPLYSVVHWALEAYFYFPFAFAYCRKRGLIPLKWRCGAAFHKGFKTEFTIVEVLCSDDNDCKVLVRLLVWVFGVRKVLDGNVPLEEGTEETTPDLPQT